MASDWAKAAVNQPSANHVGKAVERIIEREAAMASEMPGQIAAWKDATERFGSWCVAPEGFTAEEGEALYVSATTHQRTLEALREAEKALTEYHRLGLVIDSAVRADQPSHAPQVKAMARGIAAALARIKEAT